MAGVPEVVWRNPLPRYAPSSLNSSSMLVPCTMSLATTRYALCLFEHSFPCHVSTPVHASTMQLYNFTRAELVQHGLFQPVLQARSAQADSKLTPSCAATMRCYYDFSPHPGWRFIVLDTYDLSTIGDRELHVVTSAYELLDKHNPNDTRSSDVDWFTGLRGPHRRFVPYNGGVGSTQLAWFKSTLRRAAALGQYIVVFGHVPVCIGACRSKRTIAWNYEDILNAMHVEGGGHVVAYIAGHAHQGGYNIDAHGIHHRTIESPLEVDPSRVAYGTVDVYDDKCDCTEACPERDVALVLRFTDGVAPPLLVMRRTQRGTPAATAFE